MANTLYNTARGDFLKGQLDWINDGVAGHLKVVLVKSSEYTFSPTHETFPEVSPASYSFTTPMNLPNTAVTADGAADADDVTFSAVTAGHQVGAIIIYKDDGAGSSRLIAYLDTATGLPITTNGGDIIITWDNGINRIFRL